MGELFPWDADIDANFIASHPLVLGSFLEEHRARLSSMGYGFILRGDRAVIHNAGDTARMDIWFSGPQDVAAFDIRARLCGVRVNFFRDQLEGTAWYYRPGEKIYGNTQGKLLHASGRATTPAFLIASEGDSGWAMTAASFLTASSTWTREPVRDGLACRK